MRDSSKPWPRDIGTPMSSAASESDEAGLPPEGSAPELAYSRATTKPLVSLHFELPDGRIHSVQYRHLDSGSRFEHDRIVLRFLGYQPVEVVIEGRNLRHLYDLIHQDRLAWVRQSARGFAENGQPVVTRIVIKELADG